jgi:hypothetical protein
MEGIQENKFVMQKTIRLWELLTAFTTLCSITGIIIWNIYTSVIETRKDVIFTSSRMDKMEVRQENLEKKWDERQNSIQKDIEAIRILIENKANRK